MSLANAGGVSATWMRQVGAAKITWNRLTPHELLKTDGQQQQLSGLIQERYAVTRDEAEAQVRRFFQRNRVLK